MKVGATWKVIHGDALAVLPTLERGSVQTIITSPPYWGLRDYGLEPIEWPSGWVGGLGLEPTLDQFLENMVAIFRELREVLRDDGTAWVNMGDTYSAGKGAQAKQRLMVPARLALDLQADGWWIRSEIVWSKPNPMPSSVRDRPTDAHEMIYLLSKRPRYFYDADAIREAAITAGEKGLGFYSNRAKAMGLNPSGNEAKDPREGVRGTNRNRRTVWTIPTQPYKGAHFATYPEKLVRPCLLAGTSERGACSVCGAPWRREVEIEGTSTPTRSPRPGIDFKGGNQGSGGIPKVSTSTTTGWAPTCEHTDAPTRPCVVLDPFCGSGTTGAVALKNGASFIGIEPSADYLALARKRISAAAPGLFSTEQAAQ